MFHKISSWNKLSNKEFSWSWNRRITLINIWRETNCKTSRQSWMFWNNLLIFLLLAIFLTVRWEGTTAIVDCGTFQRLSYYKFLASKTARIFLIDELTNNVWLTLVYAAATTILGIKNWWKNINLSPYIVSSIYVFFWKTPRVSLCD